MNQMPKKPIAGALVVLLDVLVAGACLCAFSFFHHIKPMWIDKNDPIDVGEKDFTKADHMTGGSLVIRTDLPDPDKIFSGSSSGGSTGKDPVTSTPDTGIPDPPIPSYDTSGDFGYKFAPLFAQDDQIRISDTAYQSHDVFMTLHSFDTTISQQTKKGSSYTNTHVVYYVMDVYVRNIENLYASYSNGYTSVENLVGDTAFGKTFAAISGDLWYGYGDSKPVIVRNGKILRKADYISTDICVLYYDGTMETITPEEYNWDEISAKHPYQIWSFGPELMNADGTAKTDIDSAVWRTNPRSAIGYVEPGHYVLISVSGYRDNNEREVNGIGMNLDALAKICEEYGCVSAYNLDGGASTYSYYNGKKLVVVSNSNGTKRSISDMICIGEIGGN